MSRPVIFVLGLSIALTASGCATGSTDQDSATTTFRSTPTTLVASTTSSAPITLATTTTKTVAPEACDSSPVPSGELGDERFDACGVGQVFVPAGAFTMGTVNPEELTPPNWATAELASETPAHEVTITTSYWIDKFEVSNGEFETFIDAGGYVDQQHWTRDGWGWRTRMGDAVPTVCPGAPREPRVCVTWHEATAYASWRGGRLPTEAEWEYAARGPDSNVYPWGATWDDSRANVVDSEHLTDVGSYPEGVSWVGAFDMAGNAMEWVSDFFSYTYYAQDVRVDPQGPDVGRKKVEKGGWWGSNPYVARSAYRHFEDPPEYQDHHIGFRTITPVG